MAVAVDAGTLDQLVTEVALDGDNRVAVPECILLGGVQRIVVGEAPRGRVRAAGALELGEQFGDVYFHGVKCLDSVIGAARSTLARSANTSAETMTVVLMTH